MNKARAAQIWAQLERRLIERCGLPNGRMLEVNRPYLIRWIGDRLKAVPVEMEEMVLAPEPPPTAWLRPPLEIQRLKDEVALNRRIKEVIDDTINDVRLAAMLERSCSRRMGYDGDDPVDYGKR
jgi:hypothetical protein